MANAEAVAWFSRLAQHVCLVRRGPHDSQEDFEQKRAAIYRSCISELSKEYPVEYEDVASLLHWYKNRQTALPWLGSDGSITRSIKKRISFPKYRNTSLMAPDPSLPNSLCCNIMAELGDLGYCAGHPIQRTTETHIHVANKVIIVDDLFFAMVEPGHTRLTKSLDNLQQSLQEHS